MVDCQITTSVKGPVENYIDVGVGATPTDVIRINDLIIDILPLSKLVVI